MPRGKRRSPDSLPDQLAQIDAAILTKKEELADLRQTKRRLEEQCRRAEMEALYELVRQSGKSPSQIAKILEQQL